MSTVLHRVAMRDRRVADKNKSRRIIVGSLALVLCLVASLGGCLPDGLVGDGDNRNSFSEASENGPSLNRTYKTNILSFSGANTDGQGTSEARSQPALETQVLSPAPLITAPAQRPAAEVLQKFYAALAALDSGKRSESIRIVHLGGDQTVDDRFASSLRDHLTGRFGNAGRGLMQPGLYPLRGMKVDRGGDWALSNAARDGVGPFGITGAIVSSSTSDAWLRFTSVEGHFDWVDVTFMTGPGQGTVAVGVDGDMKLIPTRSATKAETSVRISTKGREIMIRPKGDGTISVLAVASGLNNGGILYSNLGLPGSTPATLEKWNAGFAAADFAKLSPDLIIFEYGIRDGLTDDLDVTRYEERLDLIIQEIKKLAPKADFLIIGPPDVARLPAFAGMAGAQACRALNKQEVAAYAKLLERHDEKLARWHAPPRLEGVRAALRRQAAKNGAYFWDWAKYMGGACSIHAWTSLKPALASADHVTLTDAGNQRSARALFTELMAGFESYQQNAKAQSGVVSAFTASVEPTKAKAKRN